MRYQDLAPIKSMIQFQWSLCSWHLNVNISLVVRVSHKFECQTVFCKDTTILWRHLLNNICVTPFLKGQLCQNMQIGKYPSTPWRRYEGDDLCQLCRLANIRSPNYILGKVGPQQITDWLISAHRTTFKKRMLLNKCRSANIRTPVDVNVKGVIFIK